MKTLKFKTAVSLALAFGLFIGCNNSQEVLEGTQDSPQVIRLSSNIDLGIKPFKANLSRLQNTQIETDRNLSLFITETADLSEPLYNNVVIKADGSGGFTHQSMFYPMSGKNIDIYAIHPYSSPADLNTDLNFSIVPDQSTNEGYLESDLLFASKTDVSRTKNSILLNFSHKLAKLEFTILEGDEADLTELNKINILNVKPSISLNTTSGVLGSASGSVLNVTAKGVHGTADPDETEVSGIEAIIIPQNIPAGVKLFEITIGNVKYYYTTTEELTFLEGKKYNLKLTIRQTGIELTSSIEDWTDGGSVSGEGEAE